MTRRPPKEIGADLRLWLSSHEMTGQQLADAINLGQGERPFVSQSWISRICTGDFQRIRGQVVAILDYADIPSETASTPDPRAAAIINAALDEIWDGSPEGARAIARVLKGAAALSGQLTRSRHRPGYGD